MNHAPTCTDSIMPINKYQTANFSKYFLIHVFLTAVALTCIFPLFWMVRSALMTKETIFTDRSLFPKVIEFGNFSTAWIDGNFGTYFINSVLYTVIVVIGILCARMIWRRLILNGHKIAYK